MDVLRSRFPASQRGTTLAQLQRMAAELNLQSRAVSCELDELKDLRLPAILHWRMDHFVVLRSVQGDRLEIIDPARGEQRKSLAEVAKSFTGVAMEISAAPAFAKRKAKSPLSLLSFVSIDRPMKLILLHALFYSLVLQVLAIISPLFLQLAIDGSERSGATSTALALVLGFGLVSVLGAFMEWVRASLVAKISATLSWDMTRRLFHHTIRLPLAWFQRRKLADAVSRFDSILSVKHLFSAGLIAVMLDGLMLVVLSVVMLLYSAPLTFLVMGGALCLALVKLATISEATRIGASTLQADIAERGFRIETMRAMQSIRSLGGEGARESAWANRYSEVVTNTLTSDRFNAGVNFFRASVEGLFYVAIIYFGAMLVQEGAFTIGAFFAYIAYRQQFNARVVSLVEYWCSYRLTDIHSHRLADIALNPTEAMEYGNPVGGKPLRGAVRFSDVRFRHSGTDQWVLDGVDATIEPGEFVAITGPSGAGKSTLLKLLPGLYRPNSGAIYFDDNPSITVPLSQLRTEIAAVLQEDELLSGTIAQNIAFFDDNIDRSKVWHCLSLAQMEQEVKALPLQVDTLIGDMGSSFSAGQKQRLLIARALYRDPAILLLDEATSHLDFQNEKAIHEVLKGLSMTRIVVAHRFETISLADRVYLMQGGRLFDGRNSSANRSPTAPERTAPIELERAA